MEQTQNLLHDECNKSIELDFMVQLLTYFSKNLIKLKLVDLEQKLDIILKRM
jgi:HKD family nuclease